MLKPLRGYVLIEQIEDELKTSSGIVLPESSKDKPSKGTVLEVGDPILRFEGGVRINPDTTCTIPDQHPDVEKGDKVVFKKWSVTDLEEDGKKLAFVKFEDILGKYE